MHSVSMFVTPSSAFATDELSSSKREAGSVLASSVSSSALALLRRLHFAFGSKSRANKCH